MITIVCYDAQPYDTASFDRHADDDRFKIVYVGDRISPANTALAHGADAVCLFVNDRVDEAVARSLAEHGVHLIALRSAGYNNIDLKAVYHHRIHVVRVPAYSPYAVAEHAAALIMTLNRKTHKAYNRTRESNFSITGLTGFDLHGKTVGIIGAGRIGRIMISIMRGFGTEVLVHDRHEPEELKSDPHISFVELPELYRRSDIISLHCPLTEQTHHLIDEEAVAMMKDQVMVINTSRGQLIDTTALVRGLKSRKIGAAGLDVYEEESEFFFHDYSLSYVHDDQLARLLSFNNVLVTSHQGFLTAEALDNIAQTTLSNISDYVQGSPLEHEICYRCDGPCLKSTHGRCF
ncbi:MAG: 2-hydroxyacid dehydrogenase [Spirochaetia bacterium]|nr:2-hydroxyacid dehydrogenase [Spirochaetia bacterium]MCF7940531.1 2-hydroxyacid dehydrogenase [Spirochaetia bacterium]